MSWDAMITMEHNTQRILNDHATDLTRLEDHAWNQYGIHRYGQSFKQGFRVAARLIIPWLLNKQLRIDELTTGELVSELRKRAASIYWPVKESDPRFWAVCDRCRTNQLFDDRGLCDNCGADVEE